MAFSSFVLFFKHLYLTKRENPDSMKFIVFICVRTRINLIAFIFLHIMFICYLIIIIRVYFFFYRTPSFLFCCHICLTRPCFYRINLTDCTRCTHRVHSYVMTKRKHRSASSRTMHADILSYTLRECPGKFNAANPSTSF